MGSTGHWPVPSGDPPLETGKAPEIFRASVSVCQTPPVPSGQWPDGTGGSPVLPSSTSRLGFIRHFAKRQSQRVHIAAAGLRHSRAPAKLRRGQQRSGLALLRYFAPLL